MPGHTPKEKKKPELYLRGAHPSHKKTLHGFSVDRVVFDDCCFQNNPCDRCKKMIDSGISHDTR